VSRGARQRGRTADERAGARHVRVLKGFSNRGTQKTGAKKGTQKGTQKGDAKRVLEKGTQKGVPKKGTQKGVRKKTGAKKGTQKGYSKRGTQKEVPKKKGYSKKRVLKGIKRGGLRGLRVRAAVFARLKWAVRGISVEPTRSNGLLCGTAVCIACSRDTHTTGALTGGSWLAAAVLHS
jgi:hypothetical protein